MKRKQKHDNRNKILILLIMLLATFFMGIGYATVNMLMEVDGSALAIVTHTMEITSVTMSNSNNAVTSNCVINSYFNTNLNTTIELGNNSAASVTYTITVFNNTGSTKAFKGPVPSYETQSNFYSNSGIKYEVSGITVGETIANQASKTFSVTFSYANGISQNKVLNSILGFNFDDYYTVTYVDFNGNNLPSIVFVSSNSIVITTTDTLTDVTVTGTVGSSSFNPTTGQLTINNITSNITITGISSGGGNGGTWSEPVEDDTTSSYDPSNVTAGTTQYNNVEGKPKVTADSNGNITHFAFTDTGSNGVTINSNYNTGVIAFDGNGFEVTLKGKFTFANCTKTICPIINASQKVNNKVNGVLIYEARSTGNAYNKSGTKVGTPYNKFRFNKYLDSSATGSDDFNVLSLVNKSVGSGRFGYNATTNSVNPYTLVFHLICTRSGTSTTCDSTIYDSDGTTIIAVPHAYMKITFSDSELGSGFNGLSVKLGYFEASTSGVSYTHNFQVLEFDVHKLT